MPMFPRTNSIAHAMPQNVVRLNSKVVYSDETAGLKHIVTIVYPADADGAEGRVSVLAPLGVALPGLSVGQAIEWSFPDGSRRTSRVQALLRGGHSNRRGSDDQAMAEGS
jgi:regulator of nucleoside diphosphate kinase